MTAALLEDIGYIVDPSMVSTTVIIAAGDSVLYSILYSCVTTVILPRTQ